MVGSDHYASDCLRSFRGMRITRTREMPEGPEATIMAEDLNDHYRSKTITCVEVLHNSLLAKNPQLLEVPCQIFDIYAVGKRPVIHTDSGFLVTFLALHGRWLFHEEKHTRLIIHFEDGDRMYYDDSSVNGWVEFVPSRTALKQLLADKGPDLLRDPPSLEEFSTLMKKRFRGTTTIVNCLLSPRLTSSIGNYLMSEILYDARLSPMRTVGSLSDNDIRILYDSCLRITRKSYAMGGFTLQDYLRPDGTHGGYVSMVYKKDMDPEGNPVVVIHGTRKTYWVPSVQK
jgi:formamidopyrimidine-DNA glycosylase